MYKDESAMPGSKRATPGMSDDNLLPFCFPAIHRKKITAGFDGGRISSDGGVMLLRNVRDPDRVTHLLPDILRARIFADSGRDLCLAADDLALGECTEPARSDPPDGRDGRSLLRQLYSPPAAVTLDIDDTVDVVHGHQQLSLFNAHYDERCFLPIHVYDTATSRPVAVLLRPGKTPSGIEVRGHLRRLVRRIRRHWPQTVITIRGDGHYGRPEVMKWCDKNAIDFVFGLPGNAVLERLVDQAADDIRTRRALDQKPCLRGFAETSYQAKSWNTDRRACARIEATTKGLDIRFVVTSIETGSTEQIYQTLYCARGQAENLIKLHKAQLASDRTSCRSPLANQMRLILHTAA
jgi:hypothetical protein